jgi:hypothetical protein
MAAAAMVIQALSEAAAGLAARLACASELARRVAGNDVTIHA